MLRNSTRNSQYRQLRTELAQIGTPARQQARDRQRKALLQQVVSLGDKAKKAREVIDIFLDGVEDEVLESIKSASTPERMMEIRAYYKACLALKGEFDALIGKAALKESKIEEMKKRKGE